MAAFILVLKDTKYSLLARSTNCIYSIVLRHGNFWPKHKHNWCLMPFIKTRHWLYLLWLIWYKQENQQEHAMLLYWVFPLTYMHCIGFFQYVGKLNLLCERSGGHLEVARNGKSLCSRNEGMWLPFFGIFKMVCGIDFVKLNPWKKCALVKLRLYCLLGCSVLLTGYEELRQLRLSQISL